MAAYTQRLRVKVTDEEKQAIIKRAKDNGIRNVSAFMRKMALNGYIIRLDLSDLKEVSRLLRINANNLNQYAKKANETGNIYLVDIQKLQMQQERLWQLLREILDKLSDL